MTRQAYSYNRRITSRQPDKAGGLGIIRLFSPGSEIAENRGKNGPKCSRKKSFQGRWAGAANGHAVDDDCGRVMIFPGLDCRYFVFLVSHDFALSMSKSEM